MRKVCVQDIENISSCKFCLYPVVPIKLGKVIKYEAKKKMSNIYLETLNIESGEIDPHNNRRVNKCYVSAKRRERCIRSILQDAYSLIGLGKLHLTTPQHFPFK